jgi:hypothetical protein
MNDNEGTIKQRDGITATMCGDRERGRPLSMMGRATLFQTLTNA